MRPVVVIPAGERLPKLEEGAWLKVTPQELALLILAAERAGNTERAAYLRAEQRLQ